MCAGVDNYIKATLNIHHYDKSHKYMGMAYKYDNSDSNNTE